ncbi:GntR family transcriptional regulator [Spelaeicoccus albus]|uniref:DNA-binding transcriptional regulator YhcF (GntR family) n=1 Tax=Spelaeicoccus albus TaxID=1280376 RepID=A0A7Z0IH36_9MICO|nr:GntR family transcriptional regulator [Spelaeicoccus albus]NYI67520.1 DNA-binding transcriptional regulator YhcF (GntR family) [Spelaeicoccus albus]
MDFTLDNDSSEPPYEQLRRQVLAGVNSGDMVVGHKLPTVRALADQLGLAVNTVAKTYRELEKSGIIETRGRRGTFIAASGGIDVKGRRAADRFAATMHDLGVDDATALKMAEAALRSR